MRLSDFKKFIEKYHDDERTLLRENPSLENLYAFSNLREGVIEWYPFRKEEKVLLIGGDNGSLCGLFLRKGLSVDVLETDEEEAKKVNIRCPDVCVTGEVSEHYDYIISIGSIKAGDYREYADTLIMAVDNRYGIKFMAGTRPNGDSYSRDDLVAKFPNARFYYPMQDYMLPVHIYSDKYLPKQGELRNYMPAYRDNEFTNMDIGAKYDEVVADGRFPEFANSFILIVSDKKPDKEPVYVKYNRTRKDMYKIRTVISEDPDGVRSVEKSALYSAGIDHIRSLADKYNILMSEGRDVDYAAPKISEDGMTATYEFIEGKTLTERIAENVAEGADVYNEISNALARIIDNGLVHNMDSIFSNYLIGGRSLGGKIKVTGIDYEWVSETELDPRFITYRALDEFYNGNSRLLGGISKNEFFRRFDITSDDVEEFRKKEDKFQEGIHGDTQAVYFDNYRLENLTVDEIKKLSRDAQKAADERAGLKAQLRDKDSLIKKMTEIKRLTDNHVANLEITVANQKAEIDNMKASLDYLLKHEALWSKAKRKAGAQFREAYPEGSDKYKKFKYTKMSVFHPMQYSRLKNTEEGRNLIEGDFKIGEEYLTHGRLHFNRVMNPEVSIIIPCYNQIEYTYRCLASIMEHTHGITYEIIIADDQSTDATTELNKFAAGLQIIRTPENMGFLKNCNNATKYAHGQYLMFLNNDTTVTDNWLTSLVNLLKKDETIGMTGSKLVYPDGRLQEAGGIIWSDGSGWNYGRGDDPDNHEYNYLRDVDYISGAAILIRTELWRKIGGFDERYAPAYCEDSDLAFEVRKAGYRVVYQPLSTVVHYEGISNGTDVNGEGLKRYQVENGVKLRNKWHKELAEQFENTGNPDPFRARERSKDKKIILFADHYVPTYDKDAGSKTTFQYIKMLMARGYEIKFLPANYLHDEPYSTELQQMGIEILYGGRMQTGIWEWIDAHAKDIHLVYLNRPHIATMYLDYIREHTSLKVIYYGHDLHFLRERREFELTGDIKSRESSQAWKSIELGLMRKTDMNYFPSQVEVDAIYEEDPEIKAKAITAFVYDDFKEPEENDYSKREGILFVGGFAHPPNKDGLLWFVKNVWPEVHRATGSTFYVVGSNADEDILKLNSELEGICIKGFVSEEELKELYGRVRVVAVPLRYGAGVKGKVVEALYYNCPIITTQVGAEGIPEAESVMNIADVPERWITELCEMYADTKRLAGMSKSAAEYIKTHNSYDAAWDIIKGDFR